jgi:hypothetical protein
MPSREEEMLSKYLSELQGAICYLAGSPAFVDAMLNMMKFADLSEEEVRCEKFVGC